MDTLIRNARPDDMPRLIEAIYQTWIEHQEHREVEDAREVRDGFAYYYTRFPDEYPPERVAIATAGEHLVSFAGVIPFPTRQAGLSIPSAQLNPVGTRQEYRNQGLASACIRLLCDQLRKEGYALFFVCGRPWMYPRLGFYPVFDVFTGTLPVHCLQEVTPAARVEPFTWDKADAFLDVYERAPHQNLLHVHRDRHWAEKKLLDWERGSLPIGTVHVQDVMLSFRGGQCGGYAFVSHGPGSVAVHEVRASDREHLLALLKAAGDTGTSVGAEQVHVEHTVPGEMLYPLILDLGGQVTARGASHLMLKILSVEALLRALQGTLRARIDASPWQGKPFALTVESHGEKVSLIAGGEMRIVVPEAGAAPDPVITIPDKPFTQLVAGHRSIDELIAAGRCPDYGEPGNSLLRALFPRHYPYVYEADMN